MRHYKLLSVLFLLLSLTVSKVWAQEPYAVLSDNNTVLTFYYDDQKAVRGGMSVAFDEFDDRGWNGASESIITVIFDDSFANCTSITSTYSWFYGCSKLTTITGISNLNTANVTDMRVMFQDCSALISLDVSNFNTANVTGMGWMFAGCSSLTTLDVSNFNTENVTDMYGMRGMFAGCSSLTTLDVSNFNTSNVTDMSDLFSGCSGLTSLDLSSFNTSNVTDMSAMFYGCSVLTTIYVGDGWSTNTVAESSIMFDGCTNLVGGAGTAYDANHIDHTYAHIDGGTANPGYFTDKNATPAIAEAYAVLSDNNTVLTFYYDNQKSARGGMDVRSFEYTYDGSILDSSDRPGWYEYRGGITRVEFDASFANCTSLTSTAIWFLGFSSLISIDGIEYLHTDNVTDMSFMFFGCTALASVDLTAFNTANVTNMSGMFYGCSGLTTLDLSNFNTANVTDMGEMFNRCSSLTTLDVSNFNTSNVTDMQGMFRGCSGLTSLDVSNFNTSNVTDMGGMFAGCSGLAALDLRHFNTSNVTSMDLMFSGSSSLTTLDLSSFNTENVTNMGGMFHGSSSLTSLDLSGFNTANVTDMDEMFEGCPALTTLDVSHFNTANVTDMEEMFKGCSSLTALDVSNFNTANVTDMIQMFDHCSALTTLDVSNFNTSNVTDMSWMFMECSSLTSLDVSHFNTSNVTDMACMFEGCSALTTLDLSNFNTSNVTEGMAEMFIGCSGLTTLDLSNFNTANVTDMEAMFLGCSSLTTIYAGEGWNTSNVTEGDQMFKGCKNLKGGAGTTFDANHTDYTYAHIDGGTNNPGYFTEKNAPNLSEAYAALSQDNTVLTFYYDDQKEARGGMDIGPFDSSEQRPWHEYCENIETVVFDASFADYDALTSTAHWFYSYKNLKNIVGISNLRTDNVTDMSRMFFGCSSLTNLDVSSFHTANVTNMGGMFGECSLTALDVSNFNTANVTSMGYMFSDCSLTSLDLSHFNTANVTNMRGMFNGCFSLTTLDVSNFNTANVTSMSIMFAYCSSLTTLDLSNFNTVNVKDMYDMFEGCSSLTTLDVSNFNTGNVTDMEWMFWGCSGLTVLDLSNFNTANVTDMLQMFSGCSSLTTIYAGEGWNTSNVTEGDQMFGGCENLVGGAGTTYDANHTDHTYAHIDGGTSNPGYFTYKNAQEVIDTAEPVLMCWRQVGGRTYELKMAPDMNDIRQNPDGWKFYRSVLSLNICSGTDTTRVVLDNGGIYSESTASVADGSNSTTSMFIDTDRGMIYIFALSKADDVYYGMDGYVYSASLDDMIFTRSQLFSHYNCGWSAYFTTDATTGLPQLVHFSSAGYYDMLSSLSVEGEWSNNRLEQMDPNDASVRYRAMRPVAVSGDTTDDEVEVDGLTYTIRDNGTAWLTWVADKSVTDISVPATIDFKGQTLNVTAVAPYAFFGCHAMTSLSLPATTKLMGDMAFNNTGKSLTNLHVEATTPPAVASAHSFAGIDVPNCLLSVPEESKGLYQAAPYWSDFLYPSQPTEVEAYAALSQDNTVLTFYYDDQKEARGGMDIGPFSAWYDNNTLHTSSGWDEHREAITSVVFDASFAEYDALTSTAYWFYGCNNLKDVQGFSNLKTDSVTNMRHMFYYCSALTSLDMGSFDTHNVTDMSCMFYGCSGLISLDLSHFDTSKVTNMFQIFRDCFSLTSLDVSHFDTSNVTNMDWMFTRCSSLTSLDVSNFHTANVTGMIQMFWGCSGLTSLDLSSFNTSNVTDMFAMFGGCSGLTSLDLSSFDIRNSTDIRYFFDGCSSLTSLDLSSFDTSNVTDMFLMFQNCSSLTTLDLSSFNTSNVTDMSTMFQYCSALKTIFVGEDWTTANVTSSYDMFYKCTNLVGGAGTTYDENHTDHTYAHIDGGTSNPGYFTYKNPAPAVAEAYAVLSDNNTVLTFYYDDQKTARGSMDIWPFNNYNERGWNDDAHNITTVVFDNSFANCTSIASTADWFYKCSSLTTITGISNLITSNVTGMGNMFFGCSSLTSLDVRDFDTSNVRNMSSMFYDCSSLTNLDVSGFNTSNVTDMRWMFYDCPSLTSLDVSNFNTSNVTDIKQMFQGCSGLTSLDVTHFNTENVTNMGGMFWGCSSLTGLDVSGFNTEKVTDMSGMFYGCSRLLSLDVRGFSTSSVTNMSGMFWGCSGLTSLDLSGFNTENVTGLRSVFEGCSSLTSLDLSGFNTSNEADWSRFFVNCSSLASIQAGSASIPDDTYATIANPNLLVFVNDQSLAPASVTNVVVNRNAKRIVLTDATEGNNNFYCPMEFTAESIEYTHQYRMATAIGISRGWETIALPFTVQTIRHERNGLLAPFRSGTEGKPFWLRTLTDHGLEAAERIEANVPYLISMPNNSVYPVEYNQAGRVTFSATNTVVPATESVVMSGNDRVLVPTFVRRGQSPDVFVVNRNEAYGSYPEGSIFVADYREVRPFEAYTLHPNGHAHILTIDELMGEGEADVIDILEATPADVVRVYDLSGVLVKTGKADDVMKKLPRGIYIVNGKKVVTK